MKVLVLNNDFTPISVTDFARGFKLVYKGKAEVLEHDEQNPIVTDQSTYKRPSVIRLLKYVVLPFKKLKPTRENIFKRDGMKCIYLGCESNKNLTLDHVIPRSRGGDNTWENLATCCSKCNGRKGDRTPEEAGMKMRQKPFKPGYGYFIRNFSKGIDVWTAYLPD
jgi:5-methylcytosine-specific restriction endonuclease McrA